MDFLKCPELFSVEEIRILWLLWLTFYYEKVKKKKNYSHSFGNEIWNLKCIICTNWPLHDLRSVKKKRCFSVFVYKRKKILYLFIKEKSTCFFKYFIFVFNAKKCQLKFKTFSRNRYFFYFIPYLDFRIYFFTQFFVYLYKLFKLILSLKHFIFLYRFFSQK